MLCVHDKASMTKTKLYNKKILINNFIMIYTPLEQFSIVSIVPIRLGNIYLSFTNSSLYLFFATGLVVLLFYYPI